MKKIVEIIRKRKGLFIFLLLILVIFIFLFYPKSYNSFFRKAKLKEVEEMEIYFRHNGRDEYESMISDKYCCRYLINDKETIKRIQQIFQSVSMKPRYKDDGAFDQGLMWNVKIIGQGEDYILNLSGGFSQRGKTALSSSLLDKKKRSGVGKKDIIPYKYDISQEDYEKIVQVLFEAINDNIKDMTIQDAVRLSEENAEWREFMYYYMVWGDMDTTNQVYIPILDTNMKIEIWYEMIITDPEYIEPIKKAVLYDKEGNEYEYFSEEARELLRKEAGE